MSVETLFNSNAKLETRTQTLDAFGGIKESFAVAQYGVVRGARLCALRDGADLVE